MPVYAGVVATGTRINLNQVKHWQILNEGIVPELFVECEYF